jgi:WD40 repeat protein
MPIWSVVSVDIGFVIGRQDDLILFGEEGNVISQKLGVPSFVLCSLSEVQFASGGGYEGTRGYKLHSDKPDGDRNDHSIKIWTTANPDPNAKKNVTPCYDLVGHAKGVNHMLRLSSSKLVSSDSGAIIVWDLEQKKKLAEIETTKEVRGMTTLPEGRFATFDDESVCIRDANDFSCLHIFPKPAHVTRLQSLRNGTCMLYPTRDNHVTILDTRQKTDSAISEYQHFVDYDFSEVLEIAREVFLCASKSKLFIWTGTKTVELEEIGTVPSCMVKLRNGDIVIGDTRGKLVLISFLAQEWQKVFRWLSLGFAEENSAFGVLPVEILYHFVEDALFRAW